MLSCQCISYLKRLIRWIINDARFNGLCGETQVKRHKQERRQPIENYMQHYLTWRTNLFQIDLYMDKTYLSVNQI